MTFLFDINVNTVILQKTKINYMSNEQIAEILKEEILEVENSKKGDPDKKIITVHLDAEMFLKMAYLFVGMHGK